MIMSPVSVIRFKLKYPTPPLICERVIRVSGRSNLKRSRSGGARDDVGNRQSRWLSGSEFLSPAVSAPSHGDALYGSVDSMMLTTVYGWTVEA